MKDPLFEIINAKAAARREADELMDKANQEHRQEQMAARGRRHSRAVNAAFRRYTALVSLGSTCIGVILMAALAIVLAVIR